jgi:uncharacterized membrane protein
MVKLFLVAAIISALGGMLWWLVATVQENERLQGNVATLEQSNSNYVTAAKLLKADNLQKQQQAIARTARIIELNKEILKAKSEVRVITKTVVTETERECLVSDIPDAIYDFMFNQGTAGVEPGSSEDLPSPDPVQ